MDDTDARALITTALTRAGLQHRVVTDGRGTRGLFSATADDHPQPAELACDAPQGWLRLRGELPLSGEVPAAALHGVNQAYLETGFCHAYHDAQARAYRVTVSLPAPDGFVPSAAAVLAAVRALLRLRRKLLTGQGDLRAAGSDTAVTATLEQAVAAVGETVSLAADERGGYSGGLRQGDGLALGLRLHTATPGIFAVDAWRLPPMRAPIDEGRVRAVEAVNAILDTGALVAMRDGFIIYRWALPYAWLVPAALRGPTIVSQAVQAFEALPPDAPPSSPSA